MKYNMSKRLLIAIFIVAIMFSSSGCKHLKSNQQTPEPIKGENIDLDQSIEPTESPSVHMENISYLREMGLQIPDMLPEDNITEEILLSLFVEAYEILGGEIDISMVNPRNDGSEAVKKLTMVGVFDSNFIYENDKTNELDYGTVAYWFMKLQDTIQKRLYWREDNVATVQDLIGRINISTVLHTWTSDEVGPKLYGIQDLLQGNATSDQLLTRLMAAEMMVSAYEDTVGIIQYKEASKPTDTDNINAWKSNQFFYWSETEEFGPKDTGTWEDWQFMSAIIYDSQLRVNLGLAEAMCPNGAVLSALVSLIRSYEDMEQKKLEERIVLNERSYDWHVNQKETGEYGNVNCMPACIEMAMRYQGLSQIPSTQRLRKENHLGGLGWNDVPAENVMKQYGLKFTDSLDIKLETMLNALDMGNILFVVYLDSDIQQGHAVIIKGYWKLGDTINFIISDPDSNMIGPFGYPEYIKDAETLMSEMRVHIPRYFIIPKGE